MMWMLWISLLVVFGGLALCGLWFLHPFTGALGPDQLTMKIFPADGKTHVQFSGKQPVGSHRRRLSSSEMISGWTFLN
jgi:hypothetical protein